MESLYGAALFIIPFALFSPGKALLIAIGLVILKRHLVGLLLNLTPLDGMDNQTFIGDKEACPNIMSVSYVKMPDGEIDSLAFSR